MAKSYKQKAAAYWAIIKANPKTSANAIGRRYQGTPLGMKKQDRNDLVKSLKDAKKFINHTNNSDMHEDTKKRLTKDIYQAAKRSTRKGLRDKPPKQGELIRDIKETIEQTFGYPESDDEFTEFYYHEED